jgi:hypothetical protein
MILDGNELPKKGKFFPAAAHAAPPASAHKRAMKLQAARFERLPETTTGHERGRQLMRAYSYAAVDFCGFALRSVAAVTWPPSNQSLMAA